MDDRSLTIEDIADDAECRGRVALGEVNDGGCIADLAGGGSLLNGLDERLRHETQMPVHLAESPLTCVAVGSGRSLEEFEAIHRSNRARARSRNGRRNGRY